MSQVHGFANHSIISVFTRENMDYQQDTYAGSMAANAHSRAAFIVQTYAHLLGAIIAFIVLETALFVSGIGWQIAGLILGLPYGFIIALGGFVLVSWFARSWASSSESLAGQYLGLAIFVVAQAIIFLPLLAIALVETGGEALILQAAGVTAVSTIGLTAIVFITRKDFSFLKGILFWAGIMALVCIGSSLIFGLELGIFFIISMIGIAGASILYDTSNILHHWPEDRYVGAATELFASVALLFWYVLQLFLSRD